MPKVCQYRLTDHYLPDKVKNQNFFCPKDAELKYDKHIVGVGDYGNLQFYFIFNDGSHTEVAKRGPSSKNKEITIPQGAVIKKVRI